MTDASLAPAVLENSGTPPAPWPLIEACGLPEIGRQLSGLSAHIAPTLSRPWVLDGNTIRLRPDRAASVTSASLILREAIELHAASDLTRSWADRILAHATALVFGATVLARRGEPAALAAFSPLADAAPQIMALHDSHDLSAARNIAERIAAFLKDRDESPQGCPDAELIRAARALPFSPPAEVLLVSGGDDRQALDWQTGTNSYGIAPGPTPWTASLGSCTASSPTVRAFDAATRLRRQLLDAAMSDSVETLAAGSIATMRTTLLAALGVTDDSTAEVVFTPSGTDAELVTLFVALGAGKPVHSVIVGQREIGSGSTEAAAGRHFCGHVPSGATVENGVQLDGLPADAVTTSKVDIRDDAGTMRTPDEVESDIASQIAAHSDRRCLVHVVEGSKTGIRLPRAQTVDRWRAEYGTRVDFVVDAAQMRIDQATAINHLRSGAMVIVTGSKFFGGPPFSGAVLIPESMTQRLSTGRAVPSGIGDYLARLEVPPRFSDLRAAARSTINAGLLLRWEAALAEIRSFHNVSPEIRDEVIRRLAAGIRNIIEGTPHVQLVDSPWTTIPERDERGFDELPTIFTFLAAQPNGRALSVDQAKAAYHLLAADLQRDVQVVEAVLGRTYQLGQPVKIFERDGEWVGGLRIAIGAPTVSEVVFDYRRGRTWIERIDRTLADVSDALHKLGLILEHVDLIETGSHQCS